MDVDRKALAASARARHLAERFNRMADEVLAPDADHEPLSKKKWIALVLRMVERSEIAMAGYRQDRDALYVGILADYLEVFADAWKTNAARFLEDGVTSLHDVNQMMGLVVDHIAERYPDLSARVALVPREFRRALAAFGSGPARKHGRGAPWQALHALAKAIGLAVSQAESIRKRRLAARLASGLPGGGLPNRSKRAKDA